MFKVLTKLTLVSLTLACHFSAFAQQRACLMEGSITVFGKKTEIKDCLQNDGIPKDHFLDSCNGIAQSAAAMGAPPAKITYLAACPAAAQATCKGLFGAPLTAFYYKRGSQTLADSKTGCISGGGKWGGG